MNNPALQRRVHGPRHRGSAAVECALVLPILILFLSFPIFYARCFWHYTVAQKAAQDATRYLSSVSAAEMRSTVLAAAAGRTAIEIAKREIAELAPGSAIADPIAYCDTVNCGSKAAGSLPTTVGMYLYVSMFDTFLGVVDTGRYGLLINADVAMNYVGN